MCCTLNVRMLVKFLIVIFSFSMLFTFCKKESYDVLVPVNYERTDDVGPLTVKLWIEGSYVKCEWTVDGEILDVDKTSQSCEPFLYGDESGIARIKFNGWDANDNQYYGELNLVIPDVATEIQFDGFISEDIESYIPIEDHEYIAKFSFYNDKNYTLKETTFNPLEVTGDTIFFTTAVAYTIDGFEKAGDNQFFIQLSISKQDEAEVLFEKKLYLKEEYYSSRSLYKDMSPVFSVDSNSEISPMFVKVDWQP